MKRMILEVHEGGKAREEDESPEVGSLGKVVSCDICDS